MTKPISTAGGMPDEQWDALLGRFHKVLARLPKQMQNAVILCDLQGLTAEQAASQLAVPVNTLSSYLSRGRARLLKHVQEHGLAVGLTSTGVAAVMPTTLATQTLQALRQPLNEFTNSLIRELFMLQFLSVRSVLTVAAVSLGLGAAGLGVFSVADGQNPTTPTAPPDIKAPPIAPNAPSEKLLNYRYVGKPKSLLEIQAVMEAEAAEGYEYTSELTISPTDLSGMKPDERVMFKNITPDTTAVLVFKFKPVVNQAWANSPLPNVLKNPDAIWRTYTVGIGQSEVICKSLIRTFNGDEKQGKQQSRIQALAVGSEQVYVLATETDHVTVKQIIARKASPLVALKADQEWIKYNYSPNKNSSAFFSFLEKIQNVFDPKRELLEFTINPENGDGIVSCRNSLLGAFIYDISGKIGSGSPWAAQPKGMWIAVHNPRVNFDQVIKSDNVLQSSLESAQLKYYAELGVSVFTTESLFDQERIKNRLVEMDRANVLLAVSTMPGLGIASKLNKSYTTVITFDKTADMELVGLIFNSPRKNQSLRSMIDKDQISLPSLEFNEATRTLTLKSSSISVIQDYLRIATQFPSVDRAGELKNLKYEVTELTGSPLFKKK